MIIQKQIELQLEKGESEYKETNDNVIIFMGQRGTGKSSVMRSFMKSLLENSSVNDEYGDFIVKLPKSNKKIRFIGIDSIDASLLEEQEDIFEAILAKMFNEFLKDNENINSESLTYEKRELYHMFSSIYKKHLNIKQRNMEDIYSSEAAIANLRDLARSVDIKQEFEQLIEKYIQVKSYREYEYSERDRYETFLVVSIDDIDMNVESGFEILEKIQRYLKVKRLIVLIAVNHEQIKLCCQKHFQSIISNSRERNIDDLNRYINHLSDQYMEKALPSYSRVYLPSVKKMDYDKNHTVRIEDNHNPKKVYSIKQNIFLEAWRKTKVRYDTEGKKRHFLEPESLRALNNWKIYRMYMPELGNEASEEFFENLDFNHRRAMDDLLFRYADEVLQSTESKMFIALSEEHIATRGRKIVTEFLYNYYNQYENNEEKINYSKGDYSKFGYSYGELLRSIYWIGRTHVYDKKLVYAILEMYSLTLTKIFYRYKCECNFEKITELKDQKDNSNYKILKEIMNESVGGSWSKFLIPCLDKNIVEIIQISPIVNYYFSGCAKNVLDKEIDLSKVRFSISKETEELIYNLKIKNDNLKNSKKILTQIVENMEWEFLLTLFLSNGEWKLRSNKKKIKQKIEEKMPFKVEQNENQDIDTIPEGIIEQMNNSNVTPKELIEQEENKNEELYLIGKSDYNIMNFINNIFEFDEKLRYFINQLIEMMGLNYPKDINKIIDEIINEIVKKKKSFYTQMYEWSINSGGMVVPIYAIDIYYNMFKRLIRDQRLFHQNVIKTNELFEILIVLLNEIQEALEKNDKAYEELEFLDENNQFSYILEHVHLLKGLEMLVKKKKKNMKITLKV